MKVQSSATGLAILLMTAASVSAATTLRIMPPDGATLAAGQRFDFESRPPRTMVDVLKGCGSS